MTADDSIPSNGVLDSLRDVVVVFSGDGSLVWWNRALLSTTGYTAAELSSHGAVGLFENPDTVREQVTAETGADRFDARLETADGEVLIHEFSVTETNGANGDERRIVCVGRDVTEARRRQHELERFEVIVESVPDAVYAIGSDGTIRYVNEQYCRMKGVPRTELIGTDIDDWILDETVEQADRMRESLRRGERDTAVVEYEFVTADGETFPAELRFGAVDEAGTDLGRVGMIRDVSNRVERERQLARQNERLEEFASIVSHDLRNPLNIAEGRLELARAECNSEHLDALERAHSRMHALIESLLTLARQGQRDLDRVELSLPDLVGECWNVVDDTDATLVVDTDATVTADETQLRRLVENLVRNAVEHGGSDVTVTVGDLSDGFYVADDGPGIAPDERGRVFESGYSTSEEGTGFGLSIVRDVADAHGWTVSVSDADSGGARFEFRGL